LIGVGPAALARSGTHQTLLMQEQKIRVPAEFSRAKIRDTDPLFATSNYPVYS